MPECCIEHARKLQEEHKQEMEQLKKELDLIKTKMGCQDEFIDKLLLLIKPPERKGAPIMEGLRGPPPLNKPLQTKPQIVTADAPYHQ